MGGVFVATRGRLRTMKNPLNIVVQVARVFPKTLRELITSASAG